MKNKLIAFLSVGFALFFVIFVFRVTDEMSNSKKIIANSSNVSDVTNLISTRLLVTENDMPLEGEWTKSNFVDKNWSNIQIPSYQIVKNNKFKEGSFAYYRIKLPKKAFENLSHLENESSLALLTIFFKKLDIIINGRLNSTNKPKNSVEATVIVPVKEGQDNLICIKGHIGPADSGIDHRNKILLGKGAELNALHSAGYKGQTAFQLVFILCKGSILFIFALIYLLLRVETSFEKFFIFGLCAVVEELIGGEYLYGPLNFNQMVYLYNLVNVGAAITVFLFFAELLKSTYSIKLIRFFFILLLVVSTALAIDALYWNHIVDLTKFMKFWNLLTVSIMIYYLPRVIKFDRILFVGLLISIALYIWGTLPSNNIGLNFKAYGNLLLFFMVAYQTFALFRREQDLLQFKDKQLLEQEKDVAIGKTASLLAHDIRKPLEQMKLVMEKMLSGEADQEFLDIAKKDIDYSIAGVDRQVNDIMNINRTNEVSLRKISFYKLLAHSIKQVMSVHQEMELELDYKFEAKDKILGDPSRLSNALVNLISNAVEAIRDIGNKYRGKIRFTTYSQEDHFVFKIFNDGPQIPSEVIDNIFKPLYTHGKANGTGLGLSSVVKTISEHRGYAKVDNIHGGVEFTLYLQLGHELDEFNFEVFQTSSRNYSYNSAKSNLDPDVLALRIFLLEDNAESTKYYESVILQLPYKIKLDVVKDHNSAEELIAKSRYDLYLMSVDAGGIGLFQKNLSYLTDEVVLYSTTITEKASDLSCKFFNELIPLESLNDISKTVYSKRLKILLVDDTKLFRVAWQMYHGEHNIKCVGSPEEALELLNDKNLEFGAYVLDYHFSNSNMNGEYLARRILQIRQDAIVFISSSVDQYVNGLRSIKKNNYDIRNTISNAKKK